ncbi:hypothetical protein D9M70_548900 [compost metagenome]
MSLLHCLLTGFLQAIAILQIQHTALLFPIRRASIFNDCIMPTCTAGAKLSPSKTAVVSPLPAGTSSEVSTLTEPMVTLPLPVPFC